IECIAKTCLYLSPIGSTRGDSFTPAPYVCRRELSPTNGGTGPGATADGNVERLVGEGAESAVLRRIEMAVDAEVDTVVDVADMDAILNDQTRLQETRKSNITKSKGQAAGRRREKRGREREG